MRLLTFYLVTTLTATAVAQTAKLIRVSELELRRAAVRTKMPEYPEEARRQRATGVAVVEIQTDQGGAVTSLQVLEAPHPSINESVQYAVKQWQFKPSTLDGQPVRYAGRLTFYFVIGSNGQAEVRNPRKVG